MWRRVATAAVIATTFCGLWAAFPAVSSLAAAPAAAVVVVGGSPLGAITSSPPALSPAFAQTTHDYIVRCQTGANAITFTLTAASGTIQVNGQSGSTATVNLSLVENQPVDVQATDPTTPSGPPTHYWIRCLPHDFPAITVNKPGNPSPGWYLTSNIVSPSPTAPYAMILDNNGTPVWYAPTPGAAINVELLPNNTLAWAPLSGPGVGADPKAAFSLYQLDTQKTQLQPTPTRPMDFHELLQLSNGDRMLLASPLLTGVTLPSTFANANGRAVDCIVQEVGPNGNLVWSWDAFEHIAPSESMIPSTVTYNGQVAADPYHCNSIDVDPSASNPSDGDVLVSLRNINAVILINRASTQVPDGKIIWKLGGSSSNQDGARILDIKHDPETSVYGQHDARFQPGGDVSIYDDQTTQTRPARGVEYHINTAATTATFVAQFPSPDGLPSGATGSFRRYDNGTDNLVGWGSKTGVDMSEFDALGHDLFDLTMDGTAYRFLKVPLTAIDVNLLRQTAGAPRPPVNVTNGLPYNPLPPKRIADTRCPPGGPDPYGCTVLGPYATHDIQVTGPNGSGQPPAGATAVVLNVTALNYSGGGYLTVYPTGTFRPSASNLNLTPGSTSANLVEVAVGTAGQVSIYNDGGLTDVIVDVEGYVGPATVANSGRFVPVVSGRIVDTRSEFNASFPPGITSLGSFWETDISVAGANSETGGPPVPPTGASAVVLNVTATGATQDSYMTVYPADQPRPRTSNLNFPAGRDVPNRVIVPLGKGGSAGHIKVYNESGPVDLVIDVNGWFTDGSAATPGGLYQGEPPVRIADSRDAYKVGQYSTLSAGQDVVVQVAGVGGVPQMSDPFPPTAVVLNVTVVEPLVGGYLTIYPADVPVPLSSDLNFEGGQTAPNLVVVKLSTSGQILITNTSDGPADFIVDVAGWYS